MVIVWRIRLATWAVVFVAAAVAAEVVRASTVGGPLPGLLVVLVVVVEVLVVWKWPPLAYAHWSYAIGDQALELQRGVFFRSRTWVPYYRVQHVDIEQGPIDRRIGLAQLLVRTASSRSGERLPGIPADEASALQAVIIERSQATDDL